MLEGSLCDWFTCCFSWGTERLHNKVTQHISNRQDWNLDVLSSIPAASISLGIFIPISEMGKPSQRDKTT